MVSRSTSFLQVRLRPNRGLPLPRPLYEIFVYSPRVEGVHLRYGKVARGGLRWSDRPQDFRTEVLGLVKAQQVKNAVIVPVGAKGGFVPKQLPPPSARGLQAEGIGPAIGSVHPHAARHHRQYRRRRDRAALQRGAPRRRRSLSGGGRRQGHRDLLRHRQCDLARQRILARRRLREGGSNGYDHKKMGITARGAWEAVKRHFREMDIDIQNDAVHGGGVGDMSGDVFGNGMLRPRIRQARRGLRSPRHLHRPRSRSRAQLRKSASACSRCRARAGATMTRS
jgi:glutamate dehydrogenase